MKRKPFLGLMGAVMAAGASSPLMNLACASPAGAGQRPNIVLILCDDLGFSDLGCYGGEINTPHLDALAQGGMRFSQFYNGARCCPTRASLLTGLYAHQTGVGHMTRDYGHPGYRGQLNRQCVTLAEVLRQSGYQTYMSGKWHVGNRQEYHPRQRGFDEYFGLIPGAGNYYRPDEGDIWLGDEPYDVPDDGSFYSTDAFSDYAARFIDQASQRPDQPFFLYLAYTAPHYPLQAWPDDIARYRGRYRQGWDSLREERYRRLLDLGLIRSDWPLSPRDDRNRPWEALSAEEQDWRDELMAVYAAMVDRMDQGIGRMIDKLKETGAYDNTLIIFMSDNGACPYTNMWGDQPRKDGQGNIIPVGGPQALYAYGWEWANAGNTPFRKYKRYTYEGGMATPMIAHWPGVIPAGGINDQVSHIIDIMPTCLAAAGARYPKTYAGESITPLEGLSLLPALTEIGSGFDRTLYWEHQGHRAVRQGPWKLVSETGRDWELYNLEKDRTEHLNLIENHQDMAAALQGLYDQWAQRCGVLPWPVRRQGPQG